MIIPRLINFVIFCVASVIVVALIIYDRMAILPKGDYWRYTGMAMAAILCTIIIEFRYHDEPLRPDQPPRRGFDVVFKKDRK